jgi:hypothetical protein
VRTAGQDYAIITEIEIRDIEMEKIFISKKDYVLFLKKKPMYKNLSKVHSSKTFPKYLLVDEYLSESFDSVGVEWFFSDFGDEPTIKLPRSYIDFMRMVVPHLVPPIALAPNRQYLMPQAYLPTLKLTIAATPTPQDRYQARYDLIKRIGGLTDDNTMELPGWAWCDHADELPPATRISKYRVHVDASEANVDQIMGFLEGKKGQNYDTLRRALHNLD